MTAEGFNRFNNIFIQGPVVRDSTLPVDYNKRNLQAGNCEKIIKFMFVPAVAFPESSFYKISCHCASKDFFRDAECCLGSEGQFDRAYYPNYPEAGSKENTPVLKDLRN
jgi:hypothetical protein